MAACAPGADAAGTGLPTAEPTGEKIPFPVEQVESLYVFGEVDLNTKLVTFLAQHHIPVFFFDYYGNFTATLYPRDYLLSGHLTVQQVRHYLSRTRRLRLRRVVLRLTINPPSTLHMGLFETITCAHPHTWFGSPTAVSSGSAG